MKNRMFTFIALAALTGCASTATTSVAEAPSPAQPQVIVQWTGYESLFPIRTTRFVTPMKSPDVVLNIASPWSLGRSSLDLLRPRCTRPIIRLDATGKVATRAIPLDVADSRPTTTLSNRCFGPAGVGESHPDE